MKRTTSGRPVLLEDRIVLLVRTTTGCNPLKTGPSAKVRLILAFSFMLIIGNSASGSAQQPRPPGQAPSPNSSRHTKGSVARPRQDGIATAKQLLAGGSLKEAISLLRGILERDPKNAEAHVLLGSALALVPRRSEAIAELRRAAELRPDSAPVYNTLGMALARFAELDAARKAFESALELDPQFADAHVNLTLVLGQLKEFDLAIGHITRAIELQGDSPASAYSHYLKGRLYDKQDMTVEALQELEKAVHLRPRFAQAYVELGTTRAKLFNEKALEAFEQAVDLAPDDANARYLLGREYLRKGKVAEAVEHLKEAARLKPNHRAVLYNLARALRKAGLTDESKVVDKKLSEILQSSTKATQNAMLVTTLGNAGVELEELGDVSGAIEKYTAALELDPLHSVFRQNLGLALCRLGRWDEGIEELREAIRIHPDNQEATRALYIALERAAEAQGKTPEQR